MNRQNQWRSMVIATGLLAAQAAQADVTITNEVSVTGGGMMSMMGSEGTVTTRISGQRARTDNRVEATSTLMKRFAPNMNSSTIVLLDEEKMINLDAEEKTWSEVSFEQMRAQMEQAMQQMEDMQGQGGLPVSEESCKWSQPVIDSKKTGEKDRFAGIKAEQHIITASQTCTVPESGQQCDMSWRMEYWNATRMPGDDEALAFQKAMAEAMGGEELMALAQTHSAGMLAMFKQGWDGVLKEFEGMRGYPVKTVMSMSIGGESCTTQGGQPIAMDEAWNAAAQAGMDAAAAQAGSMAAREAGQAVGGGVGGAIAGSAMGEASRKFATGMFKKFGRKDEESEPAGAAGAQSPAGSVTLFTISSVLTDVNDKRIEADRFKVPEGWKRVN